MILSPVQEDFLRGFLQNFIVKNPDSDEAKTLQSLKILETLDKNQNLYSIRRDIEVLLEGMNIHAIPEELMEQIVQRVSNYDFSDYNEYIIEQINAVLGR